MSLSLANDADHGANMAKTHGYAPVNGLQMYYEIDGEGAPLVFIRRHLAVADVHAVPALVRNVTGTGSTKTFATSARATRLSPAWCGCWVGMALTK